MSTSFFNTKIKIIFAVLGVLILILILLLVTKPSNQIEFISPANGENNIAIDSYISIKFSKPLQPADTTLTISPSIPFKTRMEENNTKLILDPDYPLSSDTNYIIEIQKPVKN